MDAGAECAALADELLDAQRLERERDVHHGGGMSLGRRQVDDPTAREEVQPASAGELVLLDQRPHLPDLAGQRPELLEIEFDVEVAGVREQRAVLHPLEVLAAQHPARAGDGDEDVAALGGGQRRHDLVACHPRLERAQRIHLADDDRGAGAAGALGHP